MAEFIQFSVANELTDWIHMFAIPGNGYKLAHLILVTNIYLLPRFT